MKLFKTSLIIFASLTLVVTFALPFQSQALTYQEIVTGQQNVPKGKVLGAVTPSPDVNNDGIVNSLDFAILKGHNGENYAPADLNKDGVVNSLDFSVLSSWYFATR